MTKIKFPAPQIDYRKFRLRDINKPEYKHMWWLLFWPIYWLRYPIIELFNPATYYHPIYSPLDDRIPFQEWFVIPYAMWLVSMLAMCLYTLLYDVESFKRYMKFLAVSMSISTVIFLIYPSCQNLRPTEFPRDNLLTRIVQMLYRADTNTNVFPSEHAIGALALLAAAVNTKSLRMPGRLILITVLTALICMSTVFLKQHSILDVVAAFPVCIAAYCVCYGRKKTGAINREQGVQVQC